MRAVLSLGVRGMNVSVSMAPVGSPFSTTPWTIGSRVSGVAATCAATSARPTSRPSTAAGPLAASFATLMSAVVSAEDGREGLAMAAAGVADESEARSIASATFSFASAASGGGSSIGALSASRKISASLVVSSSLGSCLTRRERISFATGAGSVGGSVRKVSDSTGTAVLSLVAGGCTAQLNRGSSRSRLSSVASGWLKSATSCVASVGDSW